MSIPTIKIVTTESGCNTVANNFGNSSQGSTLLKITNISTAPALLTFAYANALTYGTTTILANTVLYVQKSPSDLLSSNATTLVLATPIRRGTV
jgi:hypothetical protein